LAAGRLQALPEQSGTYRETPKIKTAAYYSQVRITSRVKGAVSPSQSVDTHLAYFGKPKQ
jgi:hypothetical protein